MVGTRSRVRAGLETFLSKVDNVEGIIRDARARTRARRGNDSSSRGRGRGRGRARERARGRGRGRGRGARSGNETGTGPTQIEDTRPERGSGSQGPAAPATTLATSTDPGEQAPPERQTDLPATKVAPVSLEQKDPPRKSPSPIASEDALQESQTLTGIVENAAAVAEQQNEPPKPASPTTSRDAPPKSQTDTAFVEKEQGGLDQQHQSRRSNSPRTCERASLESEAHAPVEETGEEDVDQMLLRQFDDSSLSVLTSLSPVGQESNATAQTVPTESFGSRWRRPNRELASKKRELESEGESAGSPSKRQKTSHDGSENGSGSQGQSETDIQGDEDGANAACETYRTLAQMCKVAWDLEYPVEGYADEDLVNTGEYMRDHNAFRAIAAVTEAISLNESGIKFSVIDFDSFELGRSHGEMGDIAREHAIGRPGNEALIPLVQNNHISLFCVERTEEDDFWFEITHLDSMVLSSHTANSTEFGDSVRSALRAVGWFEEDSDLRMTGGAILIQDLPGQSQGWSCGLHTVLWAWALALGFTISADAWPTEDDFYEEAVYLINLAMQGHMDSQTIEAFLRCHRIVPYDERVEVDRHFESTIPFPTDFSLVRHVARVRIETGLDEYRELGERLPALDEMLRVIGEENAILTDVSPHQIYDRYRVFVQNSSSQSSPGARGQPEQAPPEGRSGPSGSLPAPTASSSRQYASPARVRSSPSVPSSPEGESTELAALARAERRRIGLRDPSRMDTLELSPSKSRSSSSSSIHRRERGYGEDYGDDGNENDVGMDEGIDDYDDYDDEGMGEGQSYDDEY